MSQFDIESFYDYCIALVKDNIGAKITEINNEKADSIVLVAPASNQYVSDFSKQLLNENLFVYYTLLDSEITGQTGHGLAQEITMLFYVCFLESENEIDTVKKSLRYTRALTEIFLNDYKSASEISTIEINQILPQSAQFQNASDWYKISGVEIKGTIFL